jgi:hypothetical protein
MTNPMKPKKRGSGGRGCNYTSEQVAAMDLTKKKKNKKKEKRMSTFATLILINA